MRAGGRPGGLHFPRLSGSPGRVGDGPPRLRPPTPAAAPPAPAGSLPWTAVGRVFCSVRRLRRVPLSFHLDFAHSKPQGMGDVGWSGSRRRTATGRTRLGHTPSRIGRPETTALSPGSRVLLGGRRHPRVVNASAATLLGLGVTGLLSASQWSSGKDCLIRFQNGIEFKGGLASNDSKAQTNARRLGRGGREPGWKLSSFVPGAGVGASICRASVSGAVRKASSFFLPPSLAL